MAEDKQSKPVQPSELDEKTRLDKLQFFMDYYGRYHDHKETMAWVATAFYLGGIAYLTNALRGLACQCCPWRVTFTALFLIAGILASVFVGWQFERRYEAAQKVKDWYEQLVLKDFPSADDKTKRRWASGMTADPRFTEYLTIVTIVGITILAIVLLNVCSC